MDSYGQSAKGKKGKYAAPISTLASSGVRKSSIIIMSGCRETIFTDLKRCVGHLCRYRAPKESSGFGEVVDGMSSNWTGARIETAKLVAELMYTAMIRTAMKPTTLRYFVLDFSIISLERRRRVS